MLKILKSSGFCGSSFVAVFANGGMIASVANILCVSLISLTAFSSVTAQVYDPYSPSANYVPYNNPIPPAYVPSDPIPRAIPSITFTPLLADTHRVPPTLAAPVVPTQLKVNDQYFDATLDGFRKYMETLKESNTEAYERILPDFESLEKQERLATVSGYTLSGLGSLLMLGATSFWQDEKLERDGSVSKTLNVKAFNLGLTMLTAGGIAKWCLSPDREDYLDFINKHNRQKNVFPIEMRLGWDTGKNLPELSAQINF